VIVFLCFNFSLDRPVLLNPQTDNLDYSGNYFQHNAYPVWLSLPIMFCLVAMLMMTIADGVKRSFQIFPPLQAYRWEVLGSLFGLIAFSLLSFMHAKPLIWGLVITACYFLLYCHPRPGLKHAGVNSSGDPHEQYCHPRENGDPFRLNFIIISL